MFLVLQHPLVDSRCFLDPETSGRLLAPGWPLAEEHKEFVRSVGIVRRRKRGGVGAWAGEECFSDAKMAFKFGSDLYRCTLGRL